ncbi:phage GP46 family protein [Roseomonas sp. USHLN139]|uniref:phage GP46 family protein n=1 Tax=Roseomonas sp. USHLN139 TaxID=3081298 RepID=UPI003B016D6C
MNGDVALIWDGGGLVADWQVGGAGEVTSAPAIETAVKVSLFTDRRAGPDDKLPLGETDPRGWWGELLDDRPIGSRLWLLRRAKRLPETLRLAEDYIREALAWLIDDGVVVRIDVAASWRSATQMQAVITLHQGSAPSTTVTASWAWQGV